MSAIPFVWFTLMWLTRRDSTSEMSEICFVLNGLLALITFCGHAARKMFREKHSFMMTPASNEEKYVSFLAEGFIYLLVSQIGFWAGSYLCKLCWPTVHVASLGALFYHMDINIALILLFATALYFVTAMSVRKLWFLVAIAIPNVYVLLHIIILALLAFSFSDFVGTMIEGNIGKNETFSVTRGSEYIVQTVKIINEIFAPVTAVSTLILFYVSYLKIREKELK
ncbi:MAG: hypothetical protein LBD21_09050 [Tannerellaceae bacterium]|nr:hypothetical protein [Tannerellaceae bacterium]